MCTGVLYFLLLYSISTKGSIVLSKYVNFGVLPEEVRVSEELSFEDSDLEETAS